MAGKRLEHLPALASLFEAAYRALAAQPFLPRAVDAAVARIAEALVEDVRTDGALEVIVTELGMTHQNQLVGSAQMAAAIAQPLFRDGVRGITFSPGLTTQETTRLIDIWVSTVRGPRGTEGFATRVWETEQAHVKVTLVPPPRAISEALGNEAERIVRDWIAAGYQQGQEVTRTSDERVVSTLKALEATDLVPETVTLDTPAWTQKVTELTTALTQPKAGAPKHYVEALLKAANSATVATELDLLAGLFERLVRWLANEVRFGEIVDVYKHAMAWAKSDPERAAAARFRGAMTSAWLMEKLLLGLDTPELSGEAMEGVRKMGVGAAKSLAAAGPKTADGKKRIQAVIAQLESDSGRKAQVASTALVTELLGQLSQLSDDAAVELLKKGLTSADQSIRKQALEAMTQAHAIMLGTTLHDRLKDPSSDVRQLALKHLLELEDPSALGPLLTHLHRPGLPVVERVMVYDAVSRIGGAKVGQALADELQSQTDVQLRVEAAKALGRIDHPKAKDVLRTEANRVLGNAEVRKACKDALGKLGGKT